MAGVSGAFLLLPFQMSVLGFDSPGVSPTNMVYNVTGIPGGVYSYLKEGRLLWPLTAVVVAGSVPGVLIGILVRLTLLSNPAPFKAFVGVVLLYIGGRLFRDSMRTRNQDGHWEVEPSNWKTEVLGFDRRELRFRFRGSDYRCSTPGVVTLSFVVGIVGGAYGIGGGALVAPIFVSLYGLPVHAVAGATLMGTLATSVIGVLAYQAIDLSPVAAATGVGPDWLLGLLFGLGGLVGMYWGAKMQKLVPSAWLKLMLAVIVVFVSARYLAGYLFS
jgi:uncharacterized membrane protein YfcA